MQGSGGDRIGLALRSLKHAVCFFVADECFFLRVPGQLPSQTATDIPQVTGGDRAVLADDIGNRLIPGLHRFDEVTHVTAWFPIGIKFCHQGIDLVLQGLVGILIFNRFAGDSLSIDTNSPGFSLDQHEFVSRGDLHEDIIRIDVLDDRVLGSVVSPFDRRHFRFATVDRQWTGAICV